MLNTLSFNMNHATPRAHALYEMAAVFDPHHPTAEGLPTETQTLCMGIYGEDADFFTLRGAVEALLSACGICLRGGGGRRLLLSSRPLRPSGARRAGASRQRGRGPSRRVREAL